MAIGPLGRKDIRRALALTRGEGWAYTRRDLLLAMALDPEGNPAVREGGRLVGLALTAHHGTWGFLGAVVVAPSHRGKGLGSSLVGAAVDHLKGRGAGSVGLESTPGTESFYQRMGFITVDRVEHLMGPTLAGKSGEGGVRPMVPEDLDAVTAIDRRTFGGERGRFLELLRGYHPRRALVAEGPGGIWGYVFGRPSRGGLRVGPWISLRPPDDALALARALGRPLSLYLPASNAAALPVLEGVGLRSVTTYSHMFTAGRSPTQLVGAILATGGPEKG